MTPVTLSIPLWRRIRNSGDDPTTVFGDSPSRILSSSHRRAFSSSSYSSSFPSFATFSFSAILFSSLSHSLVFLFLSLSLVLFFRSSSSFTTYSFLFLFRFLPTSLYIKHLTFPRHGLCLSWRTTPRRRPSTRTSLLRPSSCFRETLPRRSIFFADLHLLDLAFNRLLISLRTRTSTSRFASIARISLFLFLSSSLSLSQSRPGGWISRERKHANALSARLFHRSHAHSRIIYQCEKTDTDDWFDRQANLWR